MRRGRTRWLANAEADHGGHDTPAESGAQEPGAGAPDAKESRSRTATRAAEPGRAGEGLAGVPALRDAYAAQERAVVAIAGRLDAVAGG